MGHLDSQVIFNRALIACRIIGFIKRVECNNSEETHKKIEKAKQIREDRLMRVQLMQG